MMSVRINTSISLHLSKVSINTVMLSSPNCMILYNSGERWKLGNGFLVEEKFCFIF